MRAGQLVTYVRGDGTSTAAVVAAVPDSGPSGFKVLDLVLAGRTVSHVPHAADRVAGKGFWVVYGTVPPPASVEPPVTPPTHKRAEKPMDKRFRGPWNEDA